MESKIIKRQEKKPETLASLEQKIMRLQNKTLSQENKIFKLEQKILHLKAELEKLQTENKKLQDEIVLPANIHAAIAAIQELEHNKPPKK